MENSLKGEGVSISINGGNYPLVYSFDAISKIEGKYDKTIIEVQEQMPRLDVVLDLLECAVVGFDGDLKTAKLPCINELQIKIRNALSIAYFGTIIIDEPEDIEKKIQDL